MGAHHVYGQEQQVETVLEVAPHIYVHDIPPFVEGELQRLYGHIRSTLPYQRIFKSTDQLSTYVARQNGSPTAVLLFRVEGRSVTVLNEMLHMSKEEVQRFATCLFGHFPDASMIRFEAIDTNLGHFSYPVQRGPREENVVITLPATPEDYVARLSNKTRACIRQRMSKLKNDYPSYRFQTYEKEDIDAELFYDLIRRKGDSIRAKKRQFSIDTDRARRLLALARECGVMYVIWINGQLAAGKIDYRLGDDQVGEVIFHEPRYNWYSLGLICNFLGISESIRKGVKRYHFGTGQNRYKLQLLGVPQHLHQLHVYRSAVSMMRNQDYVAKVLIQTQISHFKTWLNTHQNALVTRFFLALFRFRHACRKAWAKLRERT